MSIFRSRTKGSQGRNSRDQEEEKEMKITEEMKNAALDELETSMGRCSVMSTKAVSTIRAILQPSQQPIAIDWDGLHAFRKYVFKRDTKVASFLEKWLYDNETRPAGDSKPSPQPDPHCNIHHQDLFRRGSAPIQWVCMDCEKEAYHYLQGQKQPDTVTISREKWQELADFHFNDIDLPEKTQLYLTGISALALGLMQETNATTFTASAELPHKASGKRYKAEFKLSLLNAEGKV
jgi:hypothetical protein